MLEAIAVFVIAADLVRRIAWWHAARTGVCPRCKNPLPLSRASRHNSAIEVETGKWQSQ